MRVRIVCYEDVDKWILGKFAIKMQENLTKLGIECDIAKVPDKSADINHHIIYYDYNGTSTGIDTLMITHVDNISKLNILKRNLETAKMGICMSKDTMLNLVNLGVPRDKLCFVNPAHDGVIKPKPKVIGITCRVQEDGRKREFFLNKLAKDISPNLFSFKIMGDGWDSQVEALRHNGFQVEYINQFNYDEYVKLIPTLDYYLYMGQDEGQMGFIDALAAGVETIVTPQGYHLDADNGISFKFDTYNELLEVLKSIENKTLMLVNSISTWNWSDYTFKHLEVWKYLLKVNMNQIYELSKITNFKDGIYSVAKFADQGEKKLTFINRINSFNVLLLGSFRHLYFLRKKR